MGVANLWFEHSCLYKHLILFVMYLSSKPKSFNKQRCIGYFHKKAHAPLYKQLLHEMVTLEISTQKKLQSTFIVLHCMLIKYIAAVRLIYKQRKLSEYMRLHFIFHIFNAQMRPVRFMVNLTRTNILFYVVDIFWNISHRQPHSPLPRS